jgi:hypothetical protein
LPVSSSYGLSNLKLGIAAQGDSKLSDSSCG